MAEKSIQDDELLLTLTRTFQTYGVAGASLSILSQASGLKRASLYHRFPGGKEEMAAAVVEFVQQRFTERVLSPLLEDGDPDERIERMAKGLSCYFEDGAWSCIFDTMSLQNDAFLIQEKIKCAFMAWRDAMKKVAVDAGLSKKEASTQADLALMQIQGALVYARVTGDKAPFKKIVKNLNFTLTGEQVMAS